MSASAGPVGRAVAVAFGLESGFERLVLLYAARLVDCLVDRLVARFVARFVGVVVAAVAAAAQVASAALVRESVGWPVTVVVQLQELLGVRFADACTPQSVRRTWSLGTLQGPIQESSLHVAI